MVSPSLSSSSSSSSCSFLLHLLLLLLLTSSFVSPIRPYCYVRDRNPYRDFASKSSYMEEKGYLRMKGELYPEGCTPLQMFHLVRHGTRYPSGGDIVAFTTELPKLRDKIVASGREGRMCPGDLNILQSWNASGLNLSLSKLLEAEGKYEQEELGAQMLNLLPNLLLHNYSRKAFRFRSTNTQRTRESARAYADEAIGGNSSIEIPIPLAWDPVLQFYERCSKYTKEVENNRAATEEVNLFVRGNYMNEVLRRVRDRTGYRALEFQDIVHMYNACRYYQAWSQNSNPSPWCAMFTHDDLVVLEYWQDLKYYYRSGYGHKINYEQACLPVQDLVQTFRKRIEEDSGPYGVYYFTHLEAILKVMARLGLFRDQLPLRHHRIRPNRLWRTSKIGPFSANIVFVLYKCPRGGVYVSVAVNERMVALPTCTSSGCSWNQFLRTVGRFENCDFDKICENSLPVFPLAENSASGGGSTSPRSLSVIILGILQTFLGFFTFGH